MKRRTALTGAAVAAGAAWGATLRADHRRIDADAAGPSLHAPLAGHPVSVVSADGTVLRADVYGPEGAPTIVLVHGWTCAAHFWTLQIQELSKQFRVVAYDLRGHARSGVAVADDYSMGAHAADLDAVLQACVPAGERPLVAGHSLGAMTLVAWAGERAGDVSQRISGAVLVSTGTDDLISETLVVRTPAGLGRAKHIIGRAVLSARAPLPKGPTPLTFRAVRFVALSRAASPAVVAFCERMVLGCPRHVRAGCGATLSQLDLGRAIANLDVPTTVIVGERDRLTPPVHARRLAESLPQLVHHVEVPRFGHMLPVESPVAVTERIAQLAGAVLPAAAGVAAA